MKRFKIVTHDGNFHPDELFAIATILLTLDLLRKKSPRDIIRTREESEIKTGDYVVDVGGVYDARANLFDHHQKDGAGSRSNGIPYASFGLAWKRFGAKLCGSKEVAEHLDVKLVQAIDAEDNGLALFTPSSEEIGPYQFVSALSSLLPTWKEKERSMDIAFCEALELVKKILAREVIRAQHFIEAKTKVIEAYEKASDKRLVVLDRPYPWIDILSKQSEPLFVVYPNARRSRWLLKCVPEEGTTFKSRRLMPSCWGGKRDAELVEETGVANVTFCHPSCYFATSMTLEGALALAELALET